MARGELRAMGGRRLLILRCYYRESTVAEDWVLLPVLSQTLESKTLDCLLENGEAWSESSFKRLAVSVIEKEQNYITQVLQKYKKNGSREPIVHILIYTSFMYVKRKIIRNLSYLHLKLEPSGNDSFVMSLEKWEMGVMEKLLISSLL